MSKYEMYKNLDKWYRKQSIKILPLFLCSRFLYDNISNTFLGS